jgi:hypothetical protein
MKKLLITSVMMFSFCIGYSQSKFEIKTTGSEYTAEQLNAAFSNSDFCGSFYQSKRNLIVFNDGSEVELKSGEELTAQGITVAPSCIISDDTHFVKSIWSISAEGYILKGFDTNTYPSEKEYYHYNNINKQ